MNKTLVFIIVVLVELLLYFSICYPKATGKVLLTAVGFALTLVLMMLSMAPFIFLNDFLWGKGTT